jgi:ATP/maltotriose-dependent transcriptional regulator MalT/DNA-binding SARP family transcriptional activator
VTREVEGRGGQAHVARPKLEARVHRALDTGHVLLEAGAGYGKSTLLESALSDEGRLVAWASCAGTGGAAGALLVRIIDGLRAGVPGAADVLGERVRHGAGGLNVRAAADSLVRDLDRLLVDPVVIVIDDGEHIAESPAALELVGSLLRAEAPMLRVALATRRTLSLGAPRLRVHGALTEFRETDLAFTSEECEALVSRSPGAPRSPEGVERLILATEGWPMAIGLATAGETLGELDRGAPRDALFGFLVKDVLEGLEPELLDAVLDSSVPRELDTTVAAALGLPEGFLHSVRERGLFLRPNPAEPQWVSYHPLFRDALRERWARLRAAEPRRALYDRAARALVAPRPAEAIELWMEAGEFDSALDAVSDHSWSLLRTAPDAVADWLERMPSEVRAKPAAALLQGQLELAAGHHLAAVPLLRRAVEGFRKSGATLHEWQARLSLCDTFFWLAEYDAMVDLAAGFDAPAARPAGVIPPAVAMWAAIGAGAVGRLEVWKSLAAGALAHPEGEALRSADALRQGSTLIPGGQLRTMLARIETALRDARQGDPLNVRPLLLFNRAFVTTYTGADREALAAWAELAEGAARAGVGGGWGAQSHVFRALIHARAGRLEPAEVHLERAGDFGASGWRTNHGAALALTAALRGETAQAAAAAQRVVTGLRRAAVIERTWGIAAVVPVLAECGEAAAAAAAIDETLTAVEATLPARHSRYLRGRLLLLRAWLHHSDGEPARADADLSTAWTEAGEALEYVVRCDWPRVELLVRDGLERGAIAPAPTVALLHRVAPDGSALAGLIDHPLADVRRLAIGPAATTGAPRIVERVGALIADPDPAVAAAAATALEELRRAPPPLTFELLGRFGMRRGGHEIDAAAWGRPMAGRIVRFLLLHRDRPVLEDELFDAFWAGTAPDAARNSLRVAISRARAVLDVPGADESVLTGSGRTYRLHIGPRDVVDVDRFIVTAAEAVAGTGPERRALLEQAAACWGGEPLPEDRYEQWAFAWREGLLDQYAEVLGALAEAADEAGDHRRAVEAARSLVELDPSNERSQRQLIRAYARSGRRGHALRQFLECRQVLVRELGVEPDDETARLQRRVLAGDAV